jgi:hypothetical protein
MHAADDDATAIKTKGWRQGSVLPVRLVESLTSSGIVAPSEHPQKFVVASHHCDVTNPSFQAEPTVELLHATILDSSLRNGHYFWGKNPRHYQLELKLAGTASIWEFSIQARVWLPRQHLLDSEPDGAVVIPHDDIRRLGLWLARRYRRPAFADNFVERTRAAAAKLRSPLKKQGHLLTSVLFLVTEQDLPRGTPYEVIIYGSVRAEDWSNPKIRASAQALLDKIEAIFGETDGVEVTECTLRSEADISLNDLRSLTRWDCDDLTLRGQDASALLPEE